MTFNNVVYLLEELFRTAGKSARRHPIYTDVTEITFCCKRWQFTTVTVQKHSETFVQGCFVLKIAHFTRRVRDLDVSHLVKNNLFTFVDYQGWRQNAPTVRGAGKCNMSAMKARQGSRVIAPIFR
jgi:hypothetical protein